MRLFAIRVILLPRRVLERILDERLSVLKTIEAVDREFNKAPGVHGKVLIIHL